MRMKLTQYWVLFGSFFAATSISAAPPVRSNIDLNDVQSRSAQDIRRFDGVIRHEPQPTSRNTIRSMFSTLWSQIARLDGIFDNRIIDNFAQEHLRLNFLSDNSLIKHSSDPIVQNDNIIPEPTLDLKEFPINAIDNKELAPSADIVGSTFAEIVAQLSDPNHENLANKRGRRSSGGIWFESLKKMDENEEAMVFAKSIISRVENFLTEKMHSGEKSLMGFVFKKLSQGSSSDDDSVDQDSRSSHSNDIMSFLMDKVKHALIAHFLNGSRNGEDGPKADIETAVTSSFLFTAYDIFTSIMKGLLAANG